MYFLPINLQEKVECIHKHTSTEKISLFQILISSKIGISKSFLSILKTGYGFNKCAQQYYNKKT